MQRQYDVIIAGGGMVGSTLACLLGNAGKRVAVLEAHEPAAFSPTEPYDLRVSAISRASQRALVGAGAWEGIAARRASPYESMLVWDATGDGEIRSMPPILVSLILGISSKTVWCNWLC